MNREQSVTELEALFRQIGRNFRNHMNSVFKGELTDSEFFYLQYLDECGPAKASDIANQFNVSLSHVTSLCDRMVKKDFIYRNRSEEDRRIVVIGLNDRGKQMIESLKGIKIKYLEDFLSPLGDDELVQLVRIYKKLSRSSVV
jgi:DNA-binding MarR family transcriptional regulator